MRRKDKPAWGKARFSFGRLSGTQFSEFTLILSERRHFFHAFCIIEEKIMRTRIAAMPVTGEIALEKFIAAALLCLALALAAGCSCETDCAPPPPPPPPPVCPCDAEADADVYTVDEEAILVAPAPEKKTMVVKEAGAKAEMDVPEPPAKAAAEDKKPASSSLLAVVKFVDVIDGETISVLWQGQETPVRLQGIEAPEAGAPDHDEAVLFLRNMITGETMELEFPDGNQEPDDQGRLTALVWVDGMNVNQAMLLNGRTGNGAADKSEE